MNAPANTALLLAALVATGHAAQAQYAVSPMPDLIKIRTDLATSPQLANTKHLTFLGYGAVADGGSFGAEFRKQAGHKLTLLFANRLYWSDKARKQNVQPVLLLTAATRPGESRLYEVVPRSAQEKRLLALLQKAQVGKGASHCDSLKPKQRLQFLEARLRDRQTVVEKR